ncbi:hypothetical protein J437_LFUL018341 [Ladona fulva]|uniref:Uncharacterized protein n=1 Tax=Ladona fulva TaxID=123851 RepID=A0A8K0KQF1_LADFU|nr:hypothetical protein J437_LFUL018341 [Ladona fulva]
MRLSSLARLLSLSADLIYWRPKPTDPLLVYKLTTVTYGVTSAPFLAIRTLHQLAKDEGDKFPRAADVLKSQTFVDDIISGADSVQDALCLQKELTQLLSLGGFQLRKWCSNSPELVHHIPGEDREIPLSFKQSEQPIYNILGIKWNSATDEFSYTVDIPEPPFSKRSVLSAVARIYDPCGWLAPARSVLSAVARIYDPCGWLAPAKFNVPTKFPAESKKYGEL